jgi:undecaprenyl-diphosphatase
MIAAVAAGAMFGSTAAAAAAGVSGLERRLFEDLYRLPAWLDGVLWAPMQLGNAFAPLAVGAGAWLVWRQWRPAAGSAAVGVGAWWLAKGVKAAVDRGRPAAELPWLDLRASAPVDGLGFVSGHATVAFALVTILRPYYSLSWRIGAYTLAAFVAFARVHLGAHLLLDVMGGGALGVLLGSAWHVAVGSP